MMSLEQPSMSSKLSNRRNDDQHVPIFDQIKELQKYFK